MVAVCNIVMNYRFLLTLSGKLSQDAGDRLMRGGVTLANLIGATEFVPLHFLI